MWVDVVKRTLTNLTDDHVNTMLPPQFHGSRKNEGNAQFVKDIDMQEERKSTVKTWMNIPPRI